MSQATIPGDPPRDPASRLWWAVPGVTIVLLALFAIVFGSEPKRVDFGTSYDASNGGSRAVFLLLEELRYPVERSRRPTGGDVRWVLFPTNNSAKDVATLDDWIKRGGIVLLGVEDAEFASHLGLSITTRGTRLSFSSFAAPKLRTHTTRGLTYTASAPDVSHVLAGEIEVTGPPTTETWGSIGPDPLVQIYRRGRGEIWLLRRPDVFANVNLRYEDNAVLACRLAEAMLAERPNGRLAFDEFCHGLRDRPSVSELLFRPPVLAATLEMLLLTMLALWRFGVRFGPLRAAPPPPRRAKEEFLNAMSELLTRHGDRGEAYRTIRDQFRHRLEESLGLPAGSPINETVQEAVRRRGVSSEPLTSLLSSDEPPGGRGPRAFLDAIYQLETTAHECFESRKRHR